MKCLAFLAKVLIAGGLIYWLFRSDRLEINSLARIVFDINTVGLVLSGIVCVFLGQLLLAMRLQLLLDFQDIKVSYSRVLGLTIIGAFFGSVLPGLVSGDVVKALYLFGDATQGKSRAVAAVMIDRILGLYSLFLLGTIAMVVAFVGGFVSQIGALVFVAPAIVVSLTCLLALMSFPGLGKLPLLRVFNSRIPIKLKNLLAAFREYLKNPRLLAIAVGLSLVNHALVIVTFVVAGILLRDSVSAFVHFIINPLAMVLNVVPLTPGGIGVTEGAFSFLFQAAGSPNGAAIGLLGRLIQYIAFATGGSIALVSVRFRRQSERRLTLAAGGVSM